MAPANLTLRLSSALIWLARAGAVASIALLLQFVIGSVRCGDPMPTAIEAIGLACFPVGVVVGFAIGWRQPLTGAAITLISLFAFYVWSHLAAGRINNGP